MIPPAVLFIHSPTATSVFLVTIFAVSAWNGASFYVEVFGRKCVLDESLLWLYPREHG